MRVIVIEPRQEKRESLVRALDPVRFRVEAVCDAKAALVAMARSMPNVALLGWPASLGRDLASIIRGADKSGRIYVVAAIDGAATPAQIDELIAGGAHAFVRMPATREEVMYHADGPRRLAAWAQAAAKADTGDREDGVDFRRMKAWDTMGALVAKDLAAMFDLPVHASEGWPVSFTGALRAATLPLSLATQQVELRMSIATDHIGATSLARVLLGQPSPGEEAINDILRELANTAAGAVKRAALAEDVTWTTGMPVTQTLTRPRTEGARCWTIALTGQAALVVVGELRERGNQRIPVAKLREGMVVVRDLRNEAGALLVPAGTRLTSSTAERVGRLLDARTIIEVACAA